MRARARRGRFLPLRCRGTSGDFADKHRTRDADVQAFDGARPRDLQRFIGEGSQLGRDAVHFVAQDDHTVGSQPGLVQVYASAAGRGKQAVAQRFQFRKHARRIRVVP